MFCLLADFATALALALAIAAAPALAFDPAPPTALALLLLALVTFSGRFSWTVLCITLIECANMGK